MGNKKAPSEEKFDAEFSRRLNNLYKEIENYKVLGHIGGVLPALYKCVSYCWAHNPKLRK